MNKKTTKTALASFSTSSYESPTMTVVDTTVEGVLCQSMKDNTFEGWGEDDDLWS